MRKMRTNKFLAATSLALTVAAFGCTTNRYPGNGEPTITTPGYGAANQAVTPGSSSGTAVVNPPMASSYVGIPQPNTDALAEAAARQAYRGRVLGTVNPGGIQKAAVVTGGQVNSPELALNPQPTINASASSSGVPAIIGDAVDEAVFLSTIGGAGSTATTAAATSAAATTVASTGAASTAATSPVAVTGAVGVGATPASGTVVPLASATSPSISGNSTFTPQVKSGVVTGTTATTSISNSINVGATPASGAMIGTTATRVSTTAKTTTAATSAKTTSTSAAARAIPVTSGLKIQQSANGQIVVSSAATSVPSTKGTVTSNATSVPSTKASTTAPSVKP